MARTPQRTEDCHEHPAFCPSALPQPLQPLGRGGTIRGLLERAKALRMTALVLTDHGNLHGA